MSKLAELKHFLSPGNMGSVLEMLLNSFEASQSRSLMAYQAR